MNVIDEYLSDEFVIEYPYMQEYDIVNSHSEITHEHNDKNILCEWTITEYFNISIQELIPVHYH